MDVALVSMPFGPIFFPSLGLSLLQAEIAEQHFTARVHYFSIRFAESIGQAFYRGIAGGDRPVSQDLAGEWLFTKALFGTHATSDSRYVEDVLEGYYSDALISRLFKARDQVEAFLDECLEVLLRERPKVVGFTSIFQQHTASLALARRVKRESPSTFIVFGGANCEAVMGAETARSFPFVDAAVSGEADSVFPELLRRVLGGTSLSGLSGVRSRDTIDHDFAKRAFENAPMVHDMDRLPFPDYRDYVEQFRASRYDRRWQPAVLIETSRGCWWGERHQCTFCGLNPESMHFRSKSGGRALSEITALVQGYPGCDLAAVDNILDMKYFKDLLPALAARRKKIGLFYETKANLKKEQIRQLRNAGIASIQVGVESLSDPVLRLMRKGVTALQNIQLLKWCKEIGVHVAWNVIWGFPGEAPAEYERVAGLLPLLMHLPAPLSGAAVRLDRFSPNFVEANRRGFVDVQPGPAFRHVYPLSDAAVANLARHFTYRYAEPRDVDRYTRTLARQLEAWRKVPKGTELLWTEAGEGLVLLDTRPTSLQPFRVLAGLAARLYRECDAIQDVQQLSRALASTAPLPTAGEIDRTLSRLVEDGLVLCDGSRYLALAVSLAEYKPPASTSRRFASLVRRHGCRRGDEWVLSTCRRRHGSGGWSGSVPRLAAARFSIDTQERIVIHATEGRTRQGGRIDGQKACRCRSVGQGDFKSQSGSEGWGGRPGDAEAESGGSVCKDTAGKGPT